MLFVHTDWLHEFCHLAAPAWDEANVFTAFILGWMRSIQSQRKWVSLVVAAPGRSQEWELSETSFLASRQYKQGMFQSNWKWGKKLTEEKTQIDGEAKK